MILFFIFWPFRFRWAGIGSDEFRTETKEAGAFRKVVIYAYRIATVLCYATIVALPVLALSDTDFTPLYMAAVALQAALWMPYNIIARMNLVICQAVSNERRYAVQFSSDIFAGWMFMMFPVVFNFILMVTSSSLDIERLIRPILKGWTGAMVYLGGIVALYYISNLVGAVIGWRTARKRQHGDCRGEA